jgi:heat shock protein HslJ
MTFKRGVLIACALAALGLLSDVAVAEPATLARTDLGSLDETYWRVADLPGRPAPPSSLVVTIGGDEHPFGSLDYSSTCYFTAGSWNAKGEGLLFGFGSSIEQSCSGASTESAGFEQALKAARSFSVDADGLTFAAADGSAVMVLRRFEPDGLEERHWRIVSFFNGAEMAAPDAQVPDFYSHHPTMMIDWPWPRVTLSGGRVSGSPGCGMLLGSYAISGDHVLIHAGSMLAGWCAQDQFILEGLVLKALNGDRLVVRDGRRMLLKDDKGVVQVVLEPVEPSALDVGRWRVLRFFNGAALEAPVREAPDAPSDRPWPAVTFAAGRFEIPEECPHVGGRYELTGKGMTIQPDPQNFAGSCIDPALEREGGLVASALAKVSKLERIGDVLLLRDDSGLIQVELSR